MSQARAARRRREREEKKANRRAVALNTLMSDVHVGIARSDHPKRGKLLQLSREMIAVYNGVDELEGKKDD